MVKQWGQNWLVNKATGLIGPFQCARSPSPKEDRVKTTRCLTVLIVVVGLVALVFGGLLGCSAKEEAEPQATEEQTEEMGEAQTDQGEPSGEAGEVEVVAFDNPEKGVCPVCHMEVEAGQIEVAMVEDKKYACCSDRCATMLTDDPDHYLTATGHEGHQH
jgi:YHS domain-containing protein